MLWGWSFGQPLFNSEKMRLSNIKDEPERIETSDLTSLGIQYFGKNNDYPQRLKQVTSASGTAISCISTYAKFIQGGGFSDPTFYRSKINSDGLTLDQLLNFVSKDIADFKGFALHFNYNLLGEITDINYVPFEHCRYGIEDESGKVSKISLHRDWTKKKRLTKINSATVKMIDVFNPIKEVVLAQILAAGGIENYHGQVLYYSFDGFGVYPKPLYDSVITDISTEAGISNVLYRNVRYNFLPAGAFIRKKSSSTPDKDENGNEIRDDFPVQFKKFQGDENANKIIDIQVEFEEEEPKFVPFVVEKRGDELKTTDEIIRSKIGRVFNQPPILRAESVATGFTTDAMMDAYKYYNSVTTSERFELERVFTRIFESWHDKTINPSKSYAITPLKYE